MEDLLTISYRFRFDNGEEKTIPLSIGLADLAMARQHQGGTPPWTELTQCQCSLCPLSPDAARFCPVALNLSDIAAEFRDFFAYQSADVTVETPERSCMKRTTVQEGLGSLVGIVMTTSGCPVMEPLKPLARFHLPFATMHETFYRVASMYLMSRYLRSQHGMEAELEVAGLREIYAAVGQVNRDFARRLQLAAEKDANANALVNLDCFAAMHEFAFDDVISELQPYFAAYLK